MEKYLETFWTDIYGKDRPERDLVQALLRMYANTETDTVSRIRHLLKALSRSAVEPYLKVMCRPVYYSYEELENQHYIFDGTLKFDGAFLFSSKPSDVFRLRLPFDLKDPVFIVDDPVKPESVLQEGIDFKVHDGFIYMKEDIRNRGFKTYFDDSVPPRHMACLWFLNSKKDFGTLQRLYGSPIEAASFDMPELINIYWDMLIEGCSEKNLRRLLCVVTDTDYLDRAGNVSEIFTENGRVCAVVDGAVYSSPESAGVRVSAGDAVRAGQFIFGNADIYTGSDTLPQEDFPILHLSEALVGPGIPGGVCVENKVSDPPELLETLLMDEVTLDSVKEKSSYELFTLLTSDDFDSVHFDKEPYNRQHIARLFEPLPFKGRDESVSLFLDKINSEAVDKGLSILDTIDDNSEAPGMHPYNLFEEYRRKLFGTNAVFVSLRSDLVPEGMDASTVLVFIKRVLNAGTSLLTFFASESIVDYSVGNISDTSDVFLVPDTLTDTFSGVTDKVTKD